MFDYAKVFMLGRATGDARLYNIDNPDRTSRAIFTVACNLPLGGKSNETRTVYRRVVALGGFANYVHRCQSEDEDGLKGRLINLIGSMDNEINRAPGLDESEQREIILVSSVADGFIKIMDRRSV